jgi:DsbC/DsbD-like thiol-disulfide interchange protein
LLTASLALPLFRQAARSQPSTYTVKLLDGGWLGDRRAAGLEIELDDGWKTYWRMPGDAGVPPDFKWSGSVNMASTTVLFPLPRRYTNASGDTVGYSEHVVLPLLIVPQDPSQPIDLRLDLFFAVCEDICIPAKTSVGLKLEMAGPSNSAHTFQEWIAKVPVPATAPLPVSAATLALESGKPVLILALDKPVTDIFVEMAGSAYFRKPDFAADGLSARLVIDNVKDKDELAGKTAMLTIDRGGAGLEQTITLV